MVSARNRAADEPCELPGLARRGHVSVLQAAAPSGTCHRTRAASALRQYVQAECLCVCTCVC